MAREGFGAAGPNVIAALNKLVDPRTIRGGAKYVVHMGDDGTPDGFEYQPTPGAPLPGRARGRRRRREADVDGAQARGRRSRSRPSRRAATVESSLYESVQKSGESTVAGQPAGRAVRLGRELLHRHPPRRSLEGGGREAVPRRPVLQVRPRAGGRIRRQGRHVPRVLLGGQGRAPRSPRQVLRREGAGGLQDDAEDAAALRPHQLEVRPQAAAPDPARRARAPGHRLRGAGRNAGVGVGERPRRRGGR